jgi:murein DD-endopeptidase MepM/ murein hydrolase activator NlpD
MTRYDGRAYWAGMIGAMAVAGCAGACGAPSTGAIGAAEAPLQAAVQAVPAPDPVRPAAPALLALPAPEPAAPLPAPLAEAPQKPRSSRLPNGYFNPMPGGVMAGYQGDTGLDIAGSPRPVYAIAPGTLDYSEPGHTLWTGPKDTPNCVRFELDKPIPWRGRKITHVYYAHLSELETLQKEGASQRRHVEGGEMLGVSGVANHSPHLHIGLLLDGEVEQYWGTFLKADEIRDLLGGYRNGTRLPAK